MNTLFIKKNLFIPTIFLIDATQKNLGRLASEISKLLNGKINSFYSPGLSQNNYIIVINCIKLHILEKKELEKIYYSNTSHRPGNLKSKSLKDLKKTISIRIIEKAINGMISKNCLNRSKIKNLFLYKDNKIDCIKKLNYNNIKIIKI